MSSTKKAYLLLGFFFMLCIGLYSQNKNLADSLKIVYKAGNFNEANRLQILKDISENEPNPNIALAFSNELMRTAKELNSEKYIALAFFSIGYALKSKGDLSAALENFLQYAKIAEKNNSRNDLAKINISIAGVYASMGNYGNAIRYYRQAIPILKEVKDTLNYANALENMGDVYNLELFKPDSALVFFNESGPIFKKLNNQIGMAYNLGNIGLAYAQKGENKIAEDKINKATAILTELGDFFPISVYLTYMADIYAQKGDWSAAFNNANKSLKLAKEYGLKEQISDAYLKLSELYEKKGDAVKSLNYYKEHITFKDSVQNITSVQQMAKIQSDFEMARKQNEVDLLNQQKTNQQNISIATAIALFLIALLAIGLYRRYLFINRTKKVIEIEKKRSDDLLLNILPSETAEELKENGRVQAKKFESVSVLFTDFKEFTQYSENLSPQDLVESVDFYYSKFDEIIDKYGLEKIKTIGDAYMCAGGLPFPTKDHALKMVQAALEIADFVEASKTTNEEHQVRFDIRIGINSGPVVSGVVGTKKFAYDIWGDTVNVAARMESNSEVGKINISENTYELIKDSFRCKYRGKIKVKNRGFMKMYFVDKRN